MLWIGTAVAIVAGFVGLLALARTKRSTLELGSVSDHWVAQHRVDPMNAGQ